MCALVTGVQTYARPISCNRDDDVRLRPIALFEYISELGEADLELCRTVRQSRAIFCDRRVRLLAQANETFTRTIETVSKGIKLQERKSVVKGTSGSVRLDFSGRRKIKEKKLKT